MNKIEEPKREYYTIDQFLPRKHGNEDGIGKLEKSFYDYYNDSKSDRHKTCFACLFGNNNYSKGYSPLMCSPNRSLYSTVNCENYYS